jgi:hypothetical protein
MDVEIHCKTVIILHFETLILLSGDITHLFDTDCMHNARIVYSKNKLHNVSIYK